MLNRLKSLILPVLFVIPVAHATGGKVSASYGYFSLAAKAGGVSSSISNPSAFHVAYLQPKWDNYELKIGYTLLMADFSGSDLGYGIDAGINYYPLSSANDEKYHDSTTSIHVHELWRPLVGFSFNQRNFQSVRNSYAGFGFNAGAERYYNEKINLKGELKIVSLSGSGESSATETTLFFGVVFKL